nr:ATP-grasp domain-containing protein [Fulvivirga sediminis]
MTPSEYQSFYDELLNKNIKLINSPEEYKHCHYLPESYSIIESLTPKSYWFNKLDDQAIVKLKEQFGNQPIIVKDFVKSEKHHWQEACFIPDASNKDCVQAVVERFLDLRGDALNEGLVFRKFEELEFLTTHSQSGMPLTKEFRMYFANGKLVQTFDYWTRAIMATWFQTLRCLMK